MEHSKHTLRRSSTTFDNISRRCPNGPVMRERATGHPLLAHANTSQLLALQRRALDLAGLYNVAEYPSPEVFIRYVQAQRCQLGDSRADGLIRWLTKKAGYQNKTVPGSSCAELVCAILTELGLSLNLRHRDAGLVFPNDLARAGLEAVPLSPSVSLATSRPDPFFCNRVNHVSSALQEALASYPNRQEFYRNVALLKIEIDECSTQADVDLSSPETGAFLHDLHTAQNGVIDRIRAREVGAMSTVLAAEQVLLAEMAAIADCHRNCSLCEVPSQCHCCAPQPNKPADHRSAPDFAHDVFTPLCEFVETHFTDADDFYGLLTCLDTGTEGQRWILGSRSFGTPVADFQYHQIWGNGCSVSDTTVELTQLVERGFLWCYRSGPHMMFQRTDRPKRRNVEA